ncbi:MAG: chromosome segregation and condensation protein ScpB [Jatrophihabitantaceae bacterium]|nr:chromosome segregation and condensation protein ScpB [Jatrophihabitantaceae bacterium]
MSDVTESDEPAAAEPSELELAARDSAAVESSAVDADADADALPEPIDPARVRALVEAILFLADAPLDPMSLAAGINLPIDAVTTALADLESGYLERSAGITLERIAGGVRLYTRDDLAPVIEQYLRDGQRTRLTQAALETVAVIAYRQPITRARISAIRGVSVDGVIRTLLTRGLIVEVGVEPETGGSLYATTDVFLEKMGLNTLDDLPSLAPLLPELDGLDIESG